MDAQTNYRQQRPPNRLVDLAGLDSILTEVREMVFYPIKFSRLYQHLGVRPPKGLLLHGPSGCGQTALALAVAGELGLPFFKVGNYYMNRKSYSLCDTMCFVVFEKASAPELIGGTSGESEQRIREVFQAAKLAAPSVLLLDALDVIAAKREVGDDDEYST